MNKKLLIVIGTIFALGFYACSHNTQIIKPIVTPIDTSSHHTTDTTIITDTIKEVVDTSVCFQRDILPIFQGSCAIGGCHDATTRAEGYTLTTYANIIARGLKKGNAAGSKLYTVCYNKSMPQSPTPKLDSTKLSLLKRWINNGANNDTNCISMCDTTKFTYQAAIVPILNTYCISCHSSSSAATQGGGTVLDNYNGVQVVAMSGTLLGDIKHSSGFHAMPKGGSMLSDCKITQFRKWIDAGALNN